MKLFSCVFLLISILCIAQLQAKPPHDEKLTLYKKRWDRLMPNQSKLQFAGSMGMFSGGPGWSYGKRDQWETDLYLGFIPEIDKIEGHMTTTLKQTYTPFRFRLNEFISVEPVTTGIYITKIFGEYFWSKLPERYPKNYYFWAVNTRFNIFVGQSFVFKMGTKTLGKELSFFYEFNTNDLYLISAFGNKTIGLKDIVGLSFGIRYRVF